MLTSLFPIIEPLILGVGDNSWDIVVLPRETYIAVERR